jgi:hypothetical protein
MSVLILPKKYPEKLKALQAQFDADAKKYNLYPLIDWDDAFKKRFHNTTLLFNQNLHRQMIKKGIDSIILFVILLMFVAHAQRNKKQNQTLL